VCVTEQAVGNGIRPRSAEWLCEQWGGDISISAEPFAGHQMLDVHVRACESESERARETEWARETRARESERKRQREREREKMRERKTFHKRWFRFVLSVLSVKKSES